MDLDMSRLRRAEQIIAGGAVAFFIFLFFFNWYGVSTNASSIAGVNLNISKSGWDTFTNSRWIWLITIIVALASVVLVATQRKLELPVQPAMIVAALGALSTILILYRIIHHPTASASFGSFHASAGIKIGIWLGLIASAAITYGGYLAMQAQPHTSPTAAAPTDSSPSERAPSESAGGEAFTGLVAGGGSRPAEPAAPAEPAPPLPPPAAAPPAAPPAPPAAPGGEAPSAT
jgi:hypothetical protein